ncbi:MAG: DoxX family protein, partial [Hyphomicrobiales bacterium]|nr:DoxX family protein [Hyphomicrobiales bacterium]
MTDLATTPARPAPSPYASFVAAAEKIPYDALALCARIFPAAVFWASGQTKVEGWRVSENAVELFREEYRLPLVDPVIAAHAAAF